jgi:adenylate cyclase
MAERTVSRRLAAILAIDMVGYSRLMAADEEGTIARQHAIRKDVIDPTIAQHGGRIVKTIGDGLLVEFPSIVSAVRCATEIQKAMASHESDVSEDRRIQYRMGVNLGDIVVDGDDILGDGVNVAARLEGIAPPGGICISQAAHDHAAQKIGIKFQDAGEHHVKNIANPIHVWRWRPDPQATASSALPLPDKPSIAVLPFTNMSGDSEQEYFSDGITEDIITALSKLRWFFVIARNSTFVYKGRGVDIKQVARDLGVRYVLEGSVRKSGARVRITGQLIEAMSGNHIWAERYDRELSDIFTLQDEITTSVTAAIEPRLVAAEAVRVETRSTDDLNAWDLVARAVSHFWKMTTAESDIAIDMLRRAVRQYPDYAPAHSMLAFAILVSTHVGWMPAGADREYAAQLAHRAAELDDGDPWAYLALGYLAFTARQTDEAVRYFRVALDLNPNFAAAYGYVGWALAFDGRSDAAIGNLQQAIRMSPRDPLNGFFLAGISAAHYLAGRYGEAVDWGRRAVQERPGIIGGHRILCASLAQAGFLDEAKSVLNKVRQMQPNISRATIQESIPYTAEPMARFLEGLHKAGLPE